MAVRRVNPNRMELLRLRNQLNVARRGHKLLKDKRDELMRQFMITVRRNDELRQQVEVMLRRASEDMVLARAVLQTPVILGALASGQENLSVQVRVENTMSVRTPIFEQVDAKHNENTGTREEMNNGLPYGMASTSGELDQAIRSLKEAFPVMMELATVEKKAQLMADEIERTRRRVNSLEYVMIPELVETIRSITMKMDENERSNLTRLMKVKDMLVEQEIEKSRKATRRALDNA